MNYLKNFYGHLSTILHHKNLVRHYCFKAGLYKQGIMHDWSKYNPIEFFAGVKYYQGGKRSPNFAEKEDKKYTDEDVNNIINRKFAEWEKRQKEKSAKAAEAERLKNMTEEEKRKHEMEELQKKIAGYEKEKAIGAMTKVARGILNDSKIVVNDELLVNLVAENAETTKANVENFVKNFNDAVQKAVAEALRGKTPRLKDGSKELTKEDILKIKNRTERQKAMAEHPELFR